MTKLTRKLFISILTVAFAFVTLGATTFAWFTLTTTAKVETFDASMQSGTGIEMSLDGGSSYKNYFTKAEILDAITQEEDGTITFNLVTSLNGIDMYRYIDLSVDAPGDSDNEEEVADTDYIEFDVWFRSPTEGARIYLLTDTSTTSLGKSWKPDGTFSYGGQSINPTTSSFDVYLADTLRMSFEKYTVTPGTLATTASGDVIIYELDPSIQGRSTDNLTNPENYRLDTAIVKTSGMVPYYNAKNSEKPIKTAFMDAVSAVLPEPIYQNSDLVGDLDKVDIEAGEGVEGYSHAPVLLTLTAAKTPHDGYYYGLMQVRIWAEGWDPDAFNSILGDSVDINLAFGGAKPKVVEP